MNNVFLVAYTKRAPVGASIAAYVLRPDGTWLGRWMIPGKPNSGAEVLTRR